MLTWHVQGNQCMFYVLNGTGKLCQLIAVQESIFGQFWYIILSVYIIEMKDIFWHFKKFQCKLHVGKNTSSKLTSLLWPIIGCHLHVLSLERDWCSLVNKTTKAMGDFKGKRGTISYFYPCTAYIRHTILGYIWKAAVGFKCTSCKKFIQSCRKNMHSVSV